MNNKILITLFLAVFLGVSQLFGQNCPTGDCATHHTDISTAELNDLDGPPIEYPGNLDNDSDCEGVAGGNCWKYIFTRHDPNVVGLYMDIGTGMGCTGEVDTCYSMIDEICLDYGDGGSHSSLSIDFGFSDVIDIWICDNSSAQVSICVTADVVTPTPVELESFTAEDRGNNVKLAWKTASEENNLMFVIQRSEDAEVFEDLAEVSGNSSTEIESSYSYIDQHPLKNAYYRLKQVDFDGEFTYSNVIYQECELFTGTIRVYPSQTRDRIAINFNSEQNTKRLLSIIHVSGELMRSETIEAECNSGYMEFDVSNYSPGIYFVTLRNERGIISSRFVVMNN